MAAQARWRRAAHGGVEQEVAARWMSRWYRGGKVVRDCRVAAENDLLWAGGIDRRGFFERVFLREGCELTEVGDDEKKRRWEDDEKNQRK